jgi:ribonuclease-3
MNIIGKYFKKNQKKSVISPKDLDFFNKISLILGFQPDNLLHYQAAFIHRSKHKVDNNGHPISYERLEFLGDAMLSLVIAEYLFVQVPHADEGYLTKMRSKIVSREHLNELGKDLKLLQFVESNIQANQVGDNIYGNVFEALIGAIYLDKGFNNCREFIFNKLIKPYVDIDRLEGKITSYKSLIIEWCQKEKIRFLFEIAEEKTQESQKHFSVKLYFDQVIVGKARATSKKKAEELAAKRAFYAFQEKISAK